MSCRTVPVMWLLCAALSCLLGKQAIAASADTQAHVQTRTDAGVFTVFVLLNLSGYDWENAPSLHPVRARVRDEMAAKLPAELLAEFREFRKNHPEHIWLYEQFALQTDGPPQFPLRDADTVSREAVSEAYADSQRQQLRDTETTLAGLDAILRKTWEVPAVRDAYAESEAEALEHGKAYAAALEKGLEKTVGYLKADPKHLHIQYVVIPNLLMSHWQNGGHEIGNAFIEVFGPRGQGREPPEGSVESAHEFVHELVAPVTKDPARVARYSPQLDDLFRRAMRYEYMKYSYGTIEAFVDECLVKALDRRILEGPPPPSTEALARSGAVAEARDGYLLEPWFYEKLADYDRGNTDFASWFDRTLSGATSEVVLRRLDELGVTTKRP